MSKAIFGRIRADVPGFTEILQNSLVGLTVSFIALSLGAALGILSGRGAFAGMLSAGIFASVTSWFGGTRIQCSGPTAPMSAVTATVVAFAFEKIDPSLSIPPDHFINQVLLLCGALLLVMAALRLGRFISLVPNVVISGFMSGIALLIWYDQVRRLLGLGGKKPLQGPMEFNVLVAAGTAAAIFLFAPLTRRVVPAAARFLPATLLAIVAATLAVDLLGLPIERISLGGDANGSRTFFNLLRQQWPTTWTLEVLLKAFPFAVQLAILCYLDTLLTALVIDKMSGEETRRDREMAAQGVATGLVALVGGIPGAQATIRSVLMLKEQATLRLAGVLVGVFVLVEMVLFREWLGLIPQAVFTGVLIKVGYDVFDWQPLRLYAREVRLLRRDMFRDFLSRHDDQPIFVTNREMLMIIGTASVTLLVGLNEAVFGFTFLFYLHNKILMRHNPMRDLVPQLETESFINQN